LISLLSLQAILVSYIDDVIPPCVLLGLDNNEDDFSSVVPLNEFSGVGKEPTAGLEEEECLLIVRSNVRGWNDIDVILLSTSATELFQ